VSNWGWHAITLQVALKCSQLCTRAVPYVYNIAIICMYLCTYAHIMYGICDTGQAWNHHMTSEISHWIGYFCDI